MKKRFFYMLALVAMLVTVPNRAWALDLNLTEIMADIQDPSNWYFVNLTAKNSTNTGGSGQVKLMTVDQDGNRVYDQFLGQEINEQMRYCLWPNGNPQGFASTVTQTGFSLIFMPGVEVDLYGIKLTTYAYYAAWAKADDGSYFAGWSYSNGATDLGLDGAEGDYEEETVLDEDEIEVQRTKPNYLKIQILPNNEKGYNQDPESYIITGKTNRTIYATFLPVQVGDYSGGRGEVIATTGQTGTAQVVLDVIGRNIDAADFNEPTLSGDWTVTSWDYGATNPDRITVNVRYTAPASIEAGKEYKTTLTVSSKGGSSVNVPLTMRSVPADRTDVTVKIGETETNTDWTSALEMIDAASDPIVLTINKNLTQTVTFARALTLDLNGYTLTGNVTTSADVLVKYSKYGGEIAGNVTVNSGVLTMEGATINGNVTIYNDGTLLNNGATIRGTVTNNGTMSMLDGSIIATGATGIVNNGTLTLNGGEINAAIGVDVQSGTPNIQKVQITATETGVLGVATIEKLAIITAPTVVKGAAIINCGQFDGALTNGYVLNSAFFKSLDGLTIPAGKKVWRVTAGPEYRNGYLYFVGDEDARKLAGVPVCTIGTTGYATLEDALAYANNNKDKEVVIVMQNDYTLPAGFFTLPAKAMLLIPFEDGQETGYELITRIAKNSVTHVDYIEPFEYRRLTMSEGAHLDVFGTVEISGRQFASDEAYAAVPYAGYGLIYMNEGASITMQGGSLMRAWGYMIGKGEMDVRRGAIVREQFQMGDWKGGQISMNMLSDWRHVFPLTQYWMQNIESPVKYHAGAVLSTATAVSAALGGLPIVATANDIKIVGVQGQGDAMFLMDIAADEENTWVRKWYDVENDIQTYEVYSSAHIGSMVLDLGNIGGMDLQMHSGWFNLPITNNMKIHLLYGYMDFTQNTELLPGAEVEIDKESTVAIVNTDGIVSGSLYIYDAEDWGNYAYDGNGSTKTKAVKYSPSWFAKTGNGTPNVRDLNNVKDAMINVHGTFDTYDGYVFTSSHGANIFSSNEDAGTFTFSISALANDYTEDVYQLGTKSESNYMYNEFSPAQLKNAENQTPAFATTAGTAEGKSYCYINGRWTLMTVDPDDPDFMVDNYGDYYAKPNAYVAVAATKTAGKFSGNADHTYSGKYEQDRLFILVVDKNENSQWWEVTVKDNLYYCADNDMYYVYDNVKGWVEKKYTITWKNWNGDLLTTYNVPYGTMAEYRSTNPEREANVDYTYDFTGWSPALGKVTTDVTYTATYTSKQRQYTIIFQTEGGAEIERQFLVRDEFPVCENEPSKPGHILRWEPALAAVTGNATYTATWLEEKPATWNIRFVNYNGTPVGEAEGYNVVAGTMPVAPANPTKDETDEFTYEFTGWKPALENATRDLTYTALFEEVAKTYAITFTDENDNILGDVQHLTYGAAPEVPNYTKEATARYTYTIDWTPKVVAVSGDQTYKADVTAITNKYTVTCQGEGCVFTGAGVYEYGATPTITVAADSKYENAAWVSGPEDGFMVTGDVIFTASATLKEDETPKYESLTLAANAVVDKAGAFEQIMNLTLTSDGESSADLRGAQNLTVMGKANFDLVQPMSARTWYAVAVPWEVNADNGVLTLGGKKLVLGKDVDFVYYDGAERAANGASDDCWKYVELSGDHTLRPGVFYMAYLLNAQSGLRFQKKPGASLHYAGEVLVAPHAAVRKDANWNGIANPATYHATLSANVTDGQIYRYNGDGYDMISLASKKFIVGEPVFVQAPEEQSVLVAAVSSAPMRVQTAPAERYDVQIAANGKMADHIFVATEADKADEYVIVKDLVKMGVSTKKAQMWVNRYDAKLCVNTIEENEDGNAFPLSIYAPQTATYELSVAPNDAEKVVYLTKDGIVIWNLTDAPYAMNLQQGTTAEYGLLISRRMPATPTALDGTNGDEQIFKYIDNNHVYILRQGKVYTVSGQLVK